VYFVDKGKLLLGPCFPQSPLGSLYCFVSHIENDKRKRHGRYAVKTSAVKPGLYLRSWRPNFHRKTLENICLHACSPCRWIFMQILHF
jgi:hypothetical protein